MEKLEELKAKIKQRGVDSILDSDDSEDPVLEPFYPPKDLPKTPRVKWEYYGKPILDIRKVPEGWTDEEPDLDTEYENMADHYYSDLDAHIERRHERLRENDMPLIFEDRLSYLLKVQTRLMKKWPRLSYPAALRLEDLIFIQNHINEIGDPNKLASTVKAIIFAYKSGILEWNQGQVAYWSHGMQLCAPRLFSWEEFGQVNHKHNEWEGFWVEGAALAIQYPRFITREDAPYMTDVTGFSTVPVDPQPMDVPRGGEEPPTAENKRVTLYPRTDRAGRDEAQTEGPEPYPALTFWLDDDTGSDTMVLQPRDLDLIRANIERGGLPRPPPAPLLGTARFNTADGESVVNDIRTLEVNMFDKKGNSMSPVWDWIECAVSTADLDHVRPLRLSGPWVRHRFYTGTSPDGTGRLYVHDRLRGFARINRVHIGESGLLPRHQYPPLELGDDSQQMIRHVADEQNRASSPQPMEDKREFQLPLRLKQAEEERKDREAKDAEDSRIAKHI
ncbi:uncharacterized protein N7483_011231 [Penicillium malachiteum]|uniref:uncharacterized protein n=1 Tax=Penicillium malachiteum TaxID=1324776 RepID=UPI00254774F6|nr:uncharacterized protein N7483_011231 [Penicillium malachiteum]KAJ5714050.1 hypothetical protein N7483_011231 [Penicillium malachiteum]